ncbi:DUF3618 domain-containing protein [Streptomyces hoynatensis]|uniref:DUF3618 domain-containing protein n=1 Tax=Streptomyces hoynatensis TaxID=1141874 RepID=A0A3A9YVG4_9ACTN|nr:DUF3618 domain-containing protein [Streptomyces hoynatensis]RKN39759.1 DUF3618 domain-containing protein [Streptomyces hoynatensis]
MPESASSPAEIEARIAERRRHLAATLDEIAVRVHPSTIAGDIRARAAATVDRTAGRALATVNRTVSGVRGQFVDEAGAPRLDRVVPAALIAVAALGLLVLSSRRRRR